jgi:hypothetical protein
MTSRTSPLHSAREVHVFDNGAENVKESIRRLNGALIWRTHSARGSRTRARATDTAMRKYGGCAVNGRAFFAFLSCVCARGEERGNKQLTAPCRRPTLTMPHRDPLEVPVM